MIGWGVSGLPGAPKDHPGYISLRWLQSQICRLLQAAAANLQGGHFSLPQAVFA